MEEIQKMDTMKPAIFLLAVALPMAGQDRKPNPLIDRALVGSEITLRVMDTITTHNNLSNPCKCYYEMNPMAPRSGAWGKQVAFQALAGFAVIEGSRFLARRHHPKLGRTLLLLDIGSETWAVQNNIRISGAK